MGAARFRVRLQAAILVMSLLLQPPFLPCVLAGAGYGGEPCEQMAGGEKHGGHLFAPSKSTRSLRILTQNPGVMFQAPVGNIILLSPPDAATMVKGQAIDGSNYKNPTI
ncbi:hypothetical protein E2562_019822 [Oryza meyeriana var. granulata]|uniref:Cupin type-1 domain-containing protein n=1 Tax=Oryza meyeriana var. granulata TaxID=110450 RepID=A0A6G1DKT2_9ORYZ|nr:hypothetical protein E2562_019822 [Oryza meyeriana var. granulata]